MRLPTSAARQYGITRRDLGSFGNASAERNLPIDWAAPSEQYSVFQSFRTRKGESFPRSHVSRARWVLPDGAVWNSPGVSDREMLGGGVPPCIAGAKRAVCSKPPDGTRYPRSTFCECMFGDLQPFIRFCNEASKSNEPWTHDGMAEMVKLAQAEGYSDFNPWSVPEADKWKPHLEYRRVKVRSDWTSSVFLDDPFEQFRGNATRMRLLGGQDPFVCPQQPTPSTSGGSVNTGIIGAIPGIPGFVKPRPDFIPSTGGGSTQVGAEVLGPVTVIPNVGGGSTVIPGITPTVFCDKGLVYAIGKDGQPTCAKPEDLKPKAEGGILAQLLLGAGAGFAVGGPVGAGVGAIAAVALFGKK